MESKLDTTARAKFRVKIKSLAEEARIIRQEARRYRGEKYRATAECVRSHNMNVVRPEARATQLAYAFARGVDYRVVENRGTKPLPSRRMAAMLRGIGGMWRLGESDLIDAVEKWGSVPCGRQPDFKPA